MTFTRYVILKPNGKLFCRYNSNQEMYFRDKEQAEKVAVTWGKVKEVKIVLDDITSSNHMNVIQDED